MKITCQSCQAKYTIADEKVAGKTVKIKCKKCGATVVVHGEGGAGGAVESASMAGAQLVNGPPQQEDEDGATRVFAEGQAPGAGGEEWTVNVTDEDQRSMTAPQLVAEYLKGVITNDSYVWKDGMADWLPFSSVPELMQMAQSGAGSSPRPAAGAPAGYGAAPEPMKSPAAAAAKRTRQAPAIDLFGTNNEMPSALPAANASPGFNAASANAQAEKLTGERNENSVLFSLSALTATENAARAQPSSPSMGSSNRPSAPRKGEGARAGFDDIMNLGGGMSQAPLLAPPPLLAPVVEPPPPPPQPIAPAMSAMQSAYPPGMGMAPISRPMQQKKSPVGLVIGIVAALALVGGVAAFFLTRGSPPLTASNDATTATAAATTAPADTGAPATPPADTQAAAATATPAPSETPSATPSAVAANEHEHEHNAGHTPPSGLLAAVDKKTAETKTPEPPPEPAKTADKTPDAPAAAGKEFDRNAAMSALSAAAGAARGCKKPDGPTGSGKVKVIFAPSGHVTSATVEGGPFAGTPTGGCVASAFRGAHVPSFDGSAVAVSKSFSIN